MVSANPTGGMYANKLREFLRMNSSKLYGSKVEEDPNEFIDKAYKVLEIMGVSFIEKGELDSYQLKQVSQI